MQKWIAEQMKTSINHWRNIFLFNSHICLKYGINHNQFVRKAKKYLDISRQSPNTISRSNPV